MTFFQRPFKCSAEGCGKSYCRKAHLDRHIENVHIVQADSQAMHFSCKEEGCTSVFTLEQNLVKHIQRHHSEEAQQNYKCDVDGCHAAFRKKHQLRNHCLSHKGVDPLKCTHIGCVRSFKTSQHLRRHLKVHQGYICDKQDCLRHCQTWSELRAHKKKDHVEVHKCVDCAKTFPQKHFLSVHIRNHHLPRTPLPCPIEKCDNVYWDRRNLTEHIKSKHLNRRFQCTEEGCSETRASKKRLKDHIQLFHLGQPISSEKTKTLVNLKKRKGRKKSIVEKLTGFKSGCVTTHHMDPIVLSDQGQGNGDAAWNNIIDSVNFVDFAVKHIDSFVNKPSTTKNHDRATTASSCENQSHGQHEDCGGVNDAPAAVVNANISLVETRDLRNDF